MNWLQRILHRQQLEQQLDRELRFHREEYVAELTRRGLSEPAARRRALLELGGSEQAKEACRDARGTRWLEDFVHDFRYALRTLRQRPGFAAVALLTLALGIGATTVMFTVVNGVLLKPLPFHNPSELFVIHGRSNNWNVAAFGEQNLAGPDFHDLQDESRSLEIGGFLNNNATLSAPGIPEYVDLREISSRLFPVLGIAPLQGRAFLADDDRPGAAPVAILTYSFWQRRFGGSASALGSTMTLDGKAYTIVAIAPASFRLYQIEPDVLIPLGQDTGAFLQNRHAHPIHVVARVRRGHTLPQAQQEISALADGLAAQFPDTNKGRTFTFAALRPDAGDVTSTIWLLLGAVGMVLLIACANVASLLLARAVSRERELAMRVALGAGRGRLVRQCLTESAVLALAGGALGVLLAAVGLRPFLVLWPGTLPRAEEAQLDWRVLLFSLGVSLVSGFFFGFAPAIRAPFRNLEQVLRPGSRSIVGSSLRLHTGFVVSEIALAIVLLSAAGMLGRAVLRLSSLDPGVNTQNVLVSRMALSPAALENPDLARAAWKDILDRTRHVPGVASVAVVDTVPMRDGNNQLNYWPSADMPEQSKMPLALATSVTPDYFQVMGIPLRGGRLFNDHDRIDTEPVVVIDEELARHAFPGQDPIGKRLWGPDLGREPLHIVGVVGHVRHWGLASDDQATVRDQFYYPFAQVPDSLVRRWSELMSIAVRTNVEPLSLVGTLRGELRGASGDQVLYEVHSLEKLASASLAQQRFLLILFGVFAVLALFLAAIGIYGVLAYLTSQRIPEMGIRLALGARIADVRWLVLRQSLSMVSFGAVFGLAAAWAAARVLVRLVDGMRSVQPSTFVVVIPVLVAAALLAAWLPAYRASRVDPVIALRHE